MLNLNPFETRESASITVGFANELSYNNRSFVDSTTPGYERARKNKPFRRLITRRLKLLSAFVREAPRKALLVSDVVVSSQGSGSCVENSRAFIDIWLGSDKTL